MFQGHQALGTSYKKWNDTKKISMATAQGITPFSNISGSTLFQSLVNRPLLSIIICHSHTLTHSDFRTFTHSLTSQQFQVCPSNGSTSFQIKSSNHWLQGHRPCFKFKQLLQTIIKLLPISNFVPFSNFQLVCNLRPFLNFGQLCNFKPLGSFVPLTHL